MSNSHNFNVARKAGLSTSVNSLDEYEFHCSRGDCKLAWFFLRHYDEFLCPDPDEVLLLSGILFGEVYDWAGKNFRKEGFGRIFLGVDEGNSMLPIPTAPAHLILTSLKGLFEKGAKQLSEISQMPRGTQQTNFEILKFISWWHYQFETIHPLYDGNGRLGRAIMGNQIRTLLAKDAFAPAYTSDETKKKYLFSLYKGQGRGEIWPLMEFLGNEINSSSESCVFSKEALGALFRDPSTKGFDFKPWDSNKANIA